MFTHLWGRGRERLRETQRVCQPPGFPRNLMPRDTVWHRGTCPRIEIGRQCMVGEHARKGDLGFSCPAPLRILGDKGQGAFPSMDSGPWGVGGAAMVPRVRLSYCKWNLPVFSSSWSPGALRPCCTQVRIWTGLELACSPALAS